MHVKNTAFCVARVVHVNAQTYKNGAHPRGVVNSQLRFGGGIL